MARYTPTFEEYTPLFPELATGHAGKSGVPGWRRMLFILLFIAVIVPLFLLVKPEPASIEPAQAVAVPLQQAEPVAAESAPPVPAPAVAAASGAISPVFAPPVQYWGPKIAEWSAAVGLDPNIAATIMQVESCGDPQAVSSAGAQGLFQVMPFHFAAGENSLDPDTNARRGLAYYVDRLQQTHGDTGLAFAGYNGGHGAAASSWDYWPYETQRYYVWTTGIYGDIQEGLTESPTLQQWLQSGGASLCNQAAQRLGISP